MKKIIVIVVLVILIIGGAIGIFICSFNNNSSSLASKDITKETSTTSSSNSKADNKTRSNSSVPTSSNINPNASTDTIPPVVTTSTNISQNNGTGNFAGILSGAKYFIGTIEGDTIIIPLNDAKVVNNQLILPEYYVDRLHEVFTLKIDSLGNNNYTFYEYYNGTNTGIFKLKLATGQFSNTLSGTYSKPGSNNLIGISLQSVLESNAFPFYCGVVNGTLVTLAQTENGEGYYESYNGDNNVFNLSFAPEDKQPANGIGLTESFNGKVTGQYNLIFNNNATQMSGNYIPESNPNIKYPVTFRCSFAPA